MDTPKDATQYPLCVRASSVTVISGMLVYGSHVVFLQPQIKCESQAVEEGSAKDVNGPIFELMVYIGMPR